ncbi:Gfo/Idh/MocA family protein [Streptomyces rishiriensis]|uniref:Gfo/Idh/MocA family protein n=1 Tax=Streptomyces rishiriensis TaxID=68264 RepID=UPI000D59C556|nr:Gfo/Idh/MocA family oxidoreductase [Streptomyces rishiriensis]
MTYDGHGHGQQRRVRLGLLGCADIAWRRTLPAAAAEPLVELVAVASRDQDKARRFAERFAGAPVDGYRALLARDDVDAVYIPLPAGLHARWIEAALRAGKHVLAEKPLTTDAATTQRLVELARSRGLLLMENFMFTYHAQHEAVRKLVADGAIGELRAFFGAFTIPELPADDIRHQPLLGGGALLDVAGYPVRAAELFLGDGLEVVGAVLRHSPERGVDLGGAALLRTASGVSAQVTFGMANSYRSSYELWGSTGRIGVHRAFTPPADHQPVIRIERDTGTQDITLPADDQFARVVRAFACGVLDGKVPPDGTGHGTDDIVKHARLIDDIRRLAT